MPCSPSKAIALGLLVAAVIAGCAQPTATLPSAATTAATSVPTVTPTPEPTATVPPPTLTSTPTTAPSPTATARPTATPTPPIKELTQAYLKEMGWETQTWDGIGTLLLKSINGVPKNINVDPKTRLGWTQELQYSPKPPWSVGTRTPQTLPGETALWLWDGQSFQAFNIKAAPVLDGQGNYLYFNNGSLAWSRPTPLPSPTAKPTATPQICPGLPANYRKYDMGSAYRVVGRNVPPENVSPMERAFFGNGRSTIAWGKLVDVNQTNHTYTIDVGEGVFTLGFDPSVTYFAILNMNNEGDPWKTWGRTDLCNVLIPGTVVAVYVQKLESGAFTTGAWQ